MAFLASIKDPSQTAFALIAGDPSTEIATGSLTQNGQTQGLALLPSCTTTLDGNLAIARPAIRLAAVQRAFGTHGIFETVCQPDYSAALTQIGATMFGMLSPCLEGDIATADLDPRNPGLQIGCVVTDRLHAGTELEEDTELPACEMLDANTPNVGGNRPCWWVESDPTTCRLTPTGLLLHVERTAAVPVDTVVDATCSL